LDVLMTESATRFISPLTLRSLTCRPVFIDMYDPDSELAEEHVEIARRAEAVIVAPASATTIAKLAQGVADDMVSLTVLATQAPVIVAPAMDHQMFENAATQANIETLRGRGYVILGPAEGRLASGRMGLGRLVETEVLIGALKQALGRRGDLAGRRVVVTAGGTREPLDPVRFISNYSSGKMGYALAEAARDRGAEATLVSTASLPAPYGVGLVRVETVAEMRDAVLAACEAADALIMAAAVSDYRPAERAGGKVKKGPERKALELERTPDFLTEVQSPIIKVGFAAETDDLVENAKAKLAEKDLDLIAANDVTDPDSGFAVDTNRVTLIDRAGRVEELPLLSKYDVAHRILDRVVALLRERR
ncbi:MAG: bifunctional phosphopantothenoylcysteine decarboxylase/phosphopantothenate--cysteine ligase CoaBC, partial [Dehalococcoidia bacterium]|nr:bifunctional phosphopantothenoylcysteine decarboxylase/phosphopantothenate--cysteine ligase CoaBC [Dehalococcoidia bacterium]